MTHTKKIDHSRHGSLLVTVTKRQLHELIRWSNTINGLINNDVYIQLQLIIRNNVFLPYKLY